jgi:hypothetical protein
MCRLWREERDECFAWARRDRAGLSSKPALDLFNLRRIEFCEAP